MYMEAVRVDLEIYGVRTERAGGGGVEVVTPEKSLK